MKYVQLVFFVLIGLILTSCKTSNQTRNEKVSRYFEYSVEDLNALIAIDFIKRKHPQCNDTCAIRVCSIFKNKTKCFSAYFPELVEKCNYSYDDELSIKHRVHVENWGTIMFSGTVKGDYNFAPFLIDSETGDIFGEVEYIIDGRYMFQLIHYKIIGDELYYSGSSYVHDSSCWE